MERLKAKDEVHFIVISTRFTFQYGEIKSFYNDGTTEMVRGGKFNELENKNGNSSYSKFYHSESGLRNSK